MAKTNAGSFCDSEENRRGSIKVEYQKAEK